MKKKNIWQILTLLCFLALLISGYAYEDESFVNINKISLLTTELNTQILLETSSPLLPPPRSYFSPESPSTLILELDWVQPGNDSLIKGKKSPLIQDIRLEELGSDSLRLAVRLKQKVPYSISTEGKQTIIELNDFQRKMGKYPVEKEKIQELKARGGRRIFLDRIDISDKSDHLNIKASLTGKAVSQVFALDNPLRLVVDLLDTIYADTSSVRTVGMHGVERVRASQFQLANPYTITRIVFDLNEPKFYTLDTGKNGVSITFHETAPPEPIPASAPPLPELEDPLSSPPEEAESPPDKIEEKKEEAAPQPADPPQAETDPTPDKTEQKKEDPGPQPADPPQEVNPPQSGTEPDSMVDVGSKEESKKPEEAETPPAPDKKKSPPTPPPTKKPPVSPPVDNGKNGALQEQFQPKTIAEPEETYKGEILSFKFKDADLRDVVLYLGDFAGLNVVFDPEVRGTVTVDLKDVPWDQALDVILRVNKMGKSLEGNILRIAPISVLTREDEEQRKLAESKELAGPIVVRTFTLSYSKAEEVQGLLRNKMSERGEIIIDSRTNTLIVSDVKDRIELIEKLITVFDTATPQVSIEARIVEATSNFVRNLGIQWGFKGIADPFYGNQTALEFPHKVLADGALIPQGIVTKGIAGPLGGYAINLPAPAFTTAIGLSFANILDTFRLDMAISALETSGEGRIISAPQVTTQNNTEAEILQGRQIPVQTVANFTVTTQYVNAALELRATPQITAEGTIIMYIEIRNNAADFANLVNGIPPIITQSAKTTVMVPDGGTTVIGGIYRTEDSITREKVPLFHKIPILGNLFKSFARTKQNRELLIFITPRIIK